MPPRHHEEDANGFVIADQVDEADIPITDINDTTLGGLSQSTDKKTKVHTPYVWTNIIWYTILHIGSAYGIYRFFYTHPLTWIWTFLLYLTSAWGITAGAHRLWAHRSYKAKLPFRILLGIFNTIAGQNSIIEWARDHRAHHKYSETDADPHNAKRGFFFAHMGWLLVKKHPMVRLRGRDIDCSDLSDDPVCIFQKRWYKPLFFLMCMAMPTAVPVYFWGENIVDAYFICAILRYQALLHATWCVNSVAHFFGNKPYDRNINPVENIFVAFGAVGEGFHNYHHVFPSDYKTSEFGWRFNPTTMLIDFMSVIGQVTHRTQMSYNAVFKRKQRTGDQTKDLIHHPGLFKSKDA